MENETISNLFQSCAENFPLLARRRHSLGLSRRPGPLWYGNIREPIAAGPTDVFRLKPVCVGNIQRFQLCTALHGHAFSAGSMRNSDSRH